jgi:uncharacterized protein
MDMIVSNYGFALFGGMLLGLSAVGYLYIFGRIAGISGLIAQVLQPTQLFKTPAFSFLLGLITIPFIYTQFFDVNIEIKASPMWMIIAGLLVGFGTRLGSGCTSGHGICGISRLSKRSIIATSVFMLLGFMTVYVIRHLWRIA